MSLFEKRRAQGATQIQNFQLVYRLKVQTLDNKIDKIQAAQIDQFQR